MSPAIPETEAQSERRGIIRATSILMVGNVSSRILGLVRETVKASLFGATGLLDAFTIATFIPESLFQLIVGTEMVNSALVPVFSDYADQEDKQALWQVVSAVLTIAFLVLAVFVLLVLFFAPQVVTLTGADELKDPTLLPTTIQLLKIVAPATLFLSLASLMSGVLYALKRFTMPAFLAATLNLTIVIIALTTRSIQGLAWGFLIGSILQVAIQLPALRDARIRWNMAWSHPAIRRIMWLYLPVVITLLLSTSTIAFSYDLAAQIGDGDGNISFMRFATTLYQFPLGLVAVALSLATLPTLSRQANGRLPDFRNTLASGLRLILSLILPATFGLFALAIPIVSLVFERGEFTPEMTTMTARVLRWYLIGLPFAAIDTMLNFASYARKDTWRPAIAGAISLGVYLLVAITTNGRLGLLSLMLADSVKHITHVILMLIFLYRGVGAIDFGSVGLTALKALAASILMGLSAYFVADWLTAVFPLTNIGNKLLVVGLSGLVAALLFIISVRLFNLKELRGLVEGRLRK